MRHVNTLSGLLLLGLAAAGVAAVVPTSGRAAPSAGPAVKAPAQVVMLVCSTEGEEISVVSSSSTDPSLKLYPKSSCTGALKAVIDSGLVVVDVAYGKDSSRITYTAMAPQEAQDFNVSRSNKDKG